MFFLVTGASGVGKSSVRKLVETEIAGEVAVRELGTLGITPKWSLRWRHQAVEQVVRLALKHSPEMTPTDVMDASVRPHSLSSLTGLWFIRPPTHR